MKHAKLTELKPGKVVNYLRVTHEVAESGSEALVTAWLNDGLLVSDVIRGDKLPPEGGYRSMAAVTLQKPALALADCWQGDARLETRGHSDCLEVDLAALHWVAEVSNSRCAGAYNLKFINYIPGNGFVATDGHRVHVYNPFGTAMRYDKREFSFTPDMLKPMPKKGGAAMVAASDDNGTQVVRIGCGGRVTAKRNEKVGAGFVRQLLDSLDSGSARVVSDAQGATRIRDGLKAKKALAIAAADNAKVTRLDEVRMALDLTGVHVGALDVVHGDFPGFVYLASKDLGLSYGYLLKALNMPGGEVYSLRVITTASSADLVEVSNAQCRAVIAPMRGAA